jgi:hypothetical protein
MSSEKRGKQPEVSSSSKRRKYENAQFANIDSVVSNVFEFLEPIDLYKSCDKVCKLWRKISRTNWVICSKFCSQFGYKDMKLNNSESLLEYLMENIKIKWKLKNIGNKMEDTVENFQKKLTNTSSLTKRIEDLRKDLDHFILMTRIATNIEQFLKESKSKCRFHIKRQYCKDFLHLLENNRFYCTDFSRNIHKTVTYQHIHYEVQVTFMSATPGKRSKICLDISIIPEESVDNFFVEISMHINDSVLCVLISEQGDQSFKVYAPQLNELRANFYSQEEPDQERDKFVLQFLFSALLPDEEICQYFHPFNWRQFITKFIREMHQHLIELTPSCSTSQDIEEYNEPSEDDLESICEAISEKEILDLLEGKTKSPIPLIIRPKDEQQRTPSKCITLRPSCLLHKYFR